MGGFYLEQLDSEEFLIAETPELILSGIEESARF
jgi:hypothetical protein